MAKALVFEGCPACERSSSDFAGYGQLVPRDLMGIVQNGAIGAGGIIALDMVLPKVLPAMSPLVRALLTGGLVLGGSYFLRDKAPGVAAGLAVGGGSIVVYKIVASLMGKIVPAAGGGAMAGYGQDVSIDESPYGVLVAEELGQEELIIE